MRLISGNKLCIPCADKYWKGQLPNIHLTKPITSELIKNNYTAPASDNNDSEEWELIFTYKDGDWKSEYINYGYRNKVTGKFKKESICMGPGGSNGTNYFNSVEELQLLKHVKDYGYCDYKEYDGFSIDDLDLSGVADA